MIAPNAPTVTPASEIQAYAGDPNFMASLARGLAVIRAFTQQRRSLTIAQLSQRTAIPRAAVRRCLYTLSMLGYVGTEDGRTYALRPRILALLDVIEQFEDLSPSPDDAGARQEDEEKRAHPAQLYGEPDFQAR